WDLVKEELSATPKHIRSSMTKTVSKPPKPKKPPRQKAQKTQKPAAVHSASLTDPSLKQQEMIRQHILQGRATPSFTLPIHYHHPHGNRMPSSTMTPAMTPGFGSAFSMPSPSICPSPWPMSTSFDGSIHSVGNGSRMLTPMPSPLTSPLPYPSPRLQQTDSHKMFHHQLCHNQVLSSVQQLQQSDAPPSFTAADEAKHRLLAQLAQKETSTSMVPQLQPPSLMKQLIANTVVSPLQSVHSPPVIVEKTTKQQHEQSSVQTIIAQQPSTSTAIPKSPPQPMPTVQKEPIPSSPRKLTFAILKLDEDDTRIRNSIKKRELNTRIIHAMRFAPPGGPPAASFLKMSPIAHSRRQDSPVKGPETKRRRMALTMEDITDAAWKQHRSSANSSARSPLQEPPVSVADESLLILARITSPSTVVKGDHQKQQEQEEETISVESSDRKSRREEWNRRQARAAKFTQRRLWALTHPKEAKDLERVEKEKADAERKKVEDERLERELAAEIETTCSKVMETLLNDIDIQLAEEEKKKNEEERIRAEEVEKALIMQVCSTIMDTLCKKVVKEEEEEKRRKEEEERIRLEELEKVAIMADCSNIMVSLCKRVVKEEEEEKSQKEEEERR
ncbi:hypothetical protein PENTCL1PPCAC_2865, partial [Pristionchus entomophagus]